ncbi:hypothetical protein E0M25_21445 [Bacillus mycoides]|uniref:hypothetical protein n=1 Tax=Bacillus mycoides TaxID=1405 RepID=UPI0010390916|nr:hypothetical protein [Bacillus mycoides]TBX73226.1 hypothetical protein E0M25_21445 [Bacillus mycoides]
MKKYVQKILMFAITLGLMFSFTVISFHDTKVSAAEIIRTSETQPQSITPLSTHSLPWSWSVSFDAYYSGSSRFTFKGSGKLNLKVTSSSGYGRKGSYTIQVKRDDPYSRDPVVGSIKVPVNGSKTDSITIKDSWLSDSYYLVFIPDSYGPTIKASGKVYK